MTSVNDGHHSSLEYWDARWAGAPDKFSTSWPDDCARALELAFIRTQLPPLHSAILEIGCGNFQLLEDPALALALQGRKYLGIDGSHEALRAARALANLHVPHAQFVQHDLTQGPPQGAGDFLLSKRTLQNLAFDARQDLWPWIGSFRHGCLIEDYRPARDNTDELRRSYGRAPLLVPEFNYPLEEYELARLDNLVGDVRVVPFMGYFYNLTRALPKLAPEGHTAAYKLSLREILRGGWQPTFGPNVAVVW
jgi:SAM-dependent methyltransferase